ncbi:DUF937 domain-containing protein [Gordonia pseudamarae]|jgi:hypothetical protein|uniref:DUF937 domain-containing protein n=1 Tax=Gordonia pseudamarae TaxID=2831662 RepID=A0ABX6IMN1_9ACTN|nr:MULTISPECIES: DUF937 domain-containing protein [Gordonia]MBD0024342.1 DUF937 domain-containing protein [Gordonia sp. (in: high G+C Gram-positive bacteria)]QHN28324.1 DUF937 domain-containing protein [Gordonia pseudamarae]QHN37193.1 DUF937 domain-containing protein [Gordonia pseudamarae]
MSDLDDLLTRIPVSDIAKQLGVDDTTARAAVEQAVPALLTGLQQQTTDEASAQGLASALAQHPADLAEGDINLADVDTADGGKIVNKIFGSETDNVAQALSGANAAAGVDQGLVQKLLPILAPIVLSYLTSKVLGGKGGGTKSSGGDLGSILGSVLGGNAGGGLGGILGSVLGGNAGGGAAKGGGLGDLLGGILGGRK